MISNIQFRPDGLLLTFLCPDPRHGCNQIYCIDLRKDIKHRALLFDWTMHSELSKGILSFAWALRCKDSFRMLFSTSTAIWILNMEFSSHAVSCFMVWNNWLGEVLLPTISPTGTMVAFVHEKDMFVLGVNGVDCRIETKSVSSLKRLSFESNSAGCFCGLAEYIAREEMGRSEGHWWSPDGTQILYTIVNESAVGSTSSSLNHYPCAGGRNAIVRLVLKSAIQDEAILNIDLSVILPTSFSTADGVEYYLARAGFWPDGSVMAQVLNRDQSHLLLLRIDPETGEPWVVLEEVDSDWINLHDLLWPFVSQYHFTNDGFCFLWGSERLGFRQLYLYHYSSCRRSARALSSLPVDGPAGAGVVQRVCCCAEIDASTLEILFLGNHGACTEIHLFSSKVSWLECPSFDTLTRLTDVAGCHDCIVAGGGGWIADHWSSLDQMPTLELRPVHRSGAAIALGQNSFRDMNSGTLTSCFRPPKLLSVLCGDSVTELQTALYLPPNSPSAAPYPAILMVYGGPTFQVVQNVWWLTVDSLAQQLVASGFAVLKCDNRGTSNRGKAFEKRLKARMGSIELDDQLCAVKHYIAEGIIDREKVGVYGWSYGGYLSIRGLCHDEALFRCAVAGAPVVSWESYNSLYTERYLGHPLTNPDIYRACNVGNRIAKLRGHLMVIHGLRDDNVHFTHCDLLFSQLLQHGKQHHAELLVLPDCGHSVGTLSLRRRVEEIITKYFLRILMDGDGSEEDTGLV